MSAPAPYQRSVGVVTEVCEVDAEDDGKDNASEDAMNTYSGTLMLRVAKVRNAVCPLMEGNGLAQSRWSGQDSLSYFEKLPDLFPGMTCEEAIGASS